MRAATIACMMLTSILFGFPAENVAGALTIPGTGTCEVALKGVAAAYERSHPSARVVIPPSAHSNGGIRQLLDGKAVLARVSRPLTPEESGMGLAYRVFARDAVVFAVGARVRARDLTARQLAEIYSGKIATWEQLNGGKGPIRVLYRRTGNSNSQLLQATFKEFRNLPVTRQGKATYYEHETLELLQKYGNSIGFTTLSSLGACSVLVSPVAIDGISPTKENILGGMYPLITEYALVYREGALPPEARNFVDFLFSKAGRKTLSEHGLVPAGK